MDDIIATSWGHLLQLLYDIPVDKHGRHRSNFVYRGLADKSWELETSLMRLGGDFVNVEHPLLRSFRKYAEPGSILSDTIWMQLTVAQHHGLPTRLMDWTTSPSVAAHFATAEENHFNRDGVIWCVDITTAHALLPSLLLDILDREYAFIFTIEMLSSIQSLNELDRYGRNAEFVLFFEPPSLDARIVNQRAIMSVMPRATSVLSTFLRNNPNLYRRIIIPKEIKWEVRDMLDQDGVNERALFPGLDGLSRWEKRYYGPGPNRQP